MESEKTTTRKGFLQKAAMAIAGTVALASISRSASAPRSKVSSTAHAPSAMARVRPATGIVERKTLS